MKKFRFYAIWLALICIVIFILQISIPGFTEIFLLNQKALQGQVWRFLTAIFLHNTENLAHLVLNLFALILFGLILEKFARDKFLWIFFLSGILANVFSVFFYPAALGASGAIFGIIGALVILKPLMVVWTYAMPLPMFLAVAVWAGLDILGIFSPSGTANLAHLSGLFVGILFGVVLRVRGEHREKPRASYIHRVEIPEHRMRRWEALYLGK